MSAQDYQTLKVRRDAACVVIHLARQRQRNAFNARMVAELSDLLACLQGEDDLRCLVLRAEGEVFCAGADLEGMAAAAAATRAENEADARRMAEMFQLLWEFPATTLALVQGAALGGGVGLVACCDVVLAAQEARFGFTEVRLGIVPAVISPFVLSKIGRPTALRYFQTGEIFGAEEARRVGLVSEIGPLPELEERLAAILERLLENGPAATRAAKRLVRNMLKDSFPALAETSRLIAEVRATEEAREGLAAFLEKRKPIWPGAGA